MGHNLLYLHLKDHIDNLMAVEYQIEIENNIPSINIFESMK